MIRAVLFDLDGVITTEKTGSGPLVRSLAFHTGIPAETLGPAYFRRNKELLMGRITHADMWDDFCHEMGANIDYALLNTAFVETPLDCEMLQMAAWCHQQCKTALVTNNKADRVAAILNYHRLYDLFDAVAVSAEIGSGKESQTIFDRVLADLEVAPEECVFIDNAEENLVVPKEMGMTTVLFDADRRDVRGLYELLNQL